MKIFIKEYLKIIASAATGIVFLFASFYLVINYYHSQELKSDIYIGENDTKLVNYKNTLDEINTNLIKYQNKKQSNEEYNEMYNRLMTCHNVMNQQDLYAKIETNRFYSPHDVYKLGANFQTQVLNICWALHLSTIKDETKFKSFKNEAPFVASQVNIITRRVSDSIDELLNNSSYFYNTNITSKIVRNYLESDYLMITDSYQDFANIVLYLSEIINEEA